MAAAPVIADATPRTGPAGSVQTSLNDLVRTGDFPGALAAVRGRDGRVRDYTAGAGDLETREKVPVNGRVRIGSTPRDVNRFLGGLLGGKLLTPPMLEQMKQTVEGLRGDAAGPA
ncbi:hypothetical protein ACQPYK_44020 [Streptosporangium sp. CA-135522]|uniref:hypothetical protein n=1 Tax=Streptosporangium sp. CA-135522 TaxID=3240072 RepID=UPI003D8BF154